MPLASTRQAQDAVAGLRAYVKSLKTDRVGEEVRLRARSLVDEFFSELEPQLAGTVADEQVLATAREQMQALLVLTQQARTRRTKYDWTLNNVKRALDAIEVSISAVRTAAGREPTDKVQKRILQTLERICPPAAASYAQALADLASERRSWRGPAVDLREALRETLDTLAPDEDVTGEPGFKLEPNAKGPTMKQKTRFILKAREQSSDARKAAEDAVNVIEDQVGAFVRSVYTRASGSVHVQRSKREVLSIQRFVETTLIELLQL